MNSLLRLPSVRYLQNDVPSGVVVFLVALPLCMGIALASGTPVLSGLIAGIIGGIVVSVFSDSELSVSGPAAGLTAVVIAGIAALGGFEAFLVSVVIAGLFQIGFGLLRIGSVTEFIPNGVIRGMLAGIGVVIVQKQLAHLVGWDHSPEIDEQVTHILDGKFSWSLFPSGVTIDTGIMLIGGICLAILIILDLPRFKGMSWKKYMPASLLVVLLGTLLNELLLVLGSPLAIERGTDQLVQIPLLGSGAQWLYTPDFSILFTTPQVWFTALTIAIIASVETLLCIEATEKLDPEQRFSNNNKELIAQGIGNTLSGLVGGLPITSVIVRTSTNVYAGAKTRTSSFIHGLILLGAVVLLAGLLNRIPLTSLAAVLIMVGYKLTSLQVVRESWEKGIDQFLPFAVTVVGVVLTDLLVGIGMGLITSLYWVIRANRFIALSTVVEGKMWMIRFNKDASFINKTELKKVLRSVPDNVHLIFDATRSSVIDHDIYETIGDFAMAATYRGIHIEYVNMFGKRRIKK